MNLYDAHLHLQEPELIAVQEETSDRWRRMGLVRAVSNGTSEADWEGVAAAAARDARVLPAYGLHPWRVSERTDDWLTVLERRLRGGPAVIGEIGLDHAVPDRADAVQEEVFLRQLDLGYQLELPVTIHCVRAWGRMEALLRGNRDRLPAPGFLLHAYSGPAEMVKGFADFGGYFSFSARAGLERAVRMRAALAAVPPDRLLIETDAPALPPPPEWTEVELLDRPSGRRLNHPANILSGYRCVSGILGRTMEELFEQVGGNFRRLFRE